MKRKKKETARNKMRKEKKTFSFSKTERNAVTFAALVLFEVREVL
jgi:hypothetical protein